MEKKERQLSYKDLFPDPGKVEKQLQKEGSPIALLLDGLRIPENIGMIFRLAEAARIRKLYTINMINFQQSRKLSRVARSADQYLEINQLYSLQEVVSLKDKNELIGLEITSLSKPYHHFKPQKPVVLIVGSEKKGISQELINVADQCIHIPMLGVQTSMNVAMATGIGVYHLLSAGGHLTNKQAAPDKY